MSLATDVQLDPDTRLTVHPLQPTIGAEIAEIAEIAGIDRRDPLDGATRDVITRVILLLVRRDPTTGSRLRTLVAPPGARGSGSVIPRPGKLHVPVKRLQA